MQSEKGTGFNNYSLCYFAKARRGLPEDADVNDIMDFYLSNCSIQASQVVHETTCLGLRFLLGKCPSGQTSAPSRHDEA